MGDEQIIEAGFLNVVATPHPKGVYLRLFQQAANTPVGFWGDMFAAIRPPVAVSGEPDLHVGQLVIWVEINPNEPAINKKRLTETSLRDLKFDVPADVGFNGRVFRYILNEKTHVVTLEIRNENGKTVSPVRARRIFSRLLSPEVLGLEAEMVEITVIPEEDALAKVLGLKRLDRVEILVKRPNADDITAKTNAIMQELDEQNAKRQELVFTRESGTPGLKLNERNETYAEVAAHNGYVVSKGKDADGEAVARSTKEYPKVVRFVLDAGATANASLRELAKRIRPNREEP